jgi:hypothetical protein
MEPYASYALFDKGVALIALCRKRGFHDRGLGLNETIEDAIRQVIAKSRAEHLPPP